MTKHEQQLLDEVNEGERDPYAEGVEAGHTGHSDAANPYPLPSDAHMEWNEGYSTVEQEDA